MRYSRDRWVFFNHPSRPVLNSAEIKYWKNTLKKILKVGIEFEFNLPNSKGKCKGENKTCACMYMSTRNCWKTCVYLGDCSKKPFIDTCQNKTKKCDKDDCKKCEHYSFKCINIFCSRFKSICYLCKDFKLNCAKCVERFDVLKNPDSIRKTINGELMPNNSYGNITRSGVHSITTDGSLLGKKGIEVITVGRRIDYWEFYKMSKNIIDCCVAKGAYLNERCSNHMHILASYYSNVADDVNAGIPRYISEMEKDMPNIILANFHQLCRRYQNAITWMSMALDEPGRMTRWEKFRVSVLDISAILNNIESVKNQVYDISGSNKYAWVNYKFTQLSPNNDINRLHVEMRSLDGMQSPSAIAAMACLFYALMIKAIEISRYGIVEIGNPEWMKQTRKVKKALLNNKKSYDDEDRFGDTSNLHKYYDTLIRESLDLVRQLKHILIQIGPAYQVLEQIAEKPIALRRCEGKSWKEIEEVLSVPVSEESILETNINEYIDLQLIDDCKTQEEWVHMVCKSCKEEMNMDFDEEEINEYVDCKKNEGNFIWSETLGTMVAL